MRTKNRGETPPNAIMATENSALIKAVNELLDWDNVKDYKRVLWDMFFYANTSEASQRFNASIRAENLIVYKALDKFFDDVEMLIHKHEKN